MVRVGRDREGHVVPEPYLMPFLPVSLPGTVFMSQDGFEDPSELLTDESPLC